MMFLTVEIADRETVSIAVKRSDTIKSVKRKICELSDIPVSQQNLNFSGHALQDDHTLYDYRISDHAVIHLHEMPKPTKNNDIIFVRNVRENQIFEIEFESPADRERIIQIKQKIVMQLKTPVDALHLFFGNKNDELRDALTLEHYGIAAGATVYLSIRKSTSDGRNIELWTTLQKSYGAMTRLQFFMIIFGLQIIASAIYMVAFIGLQQLHHE